MTAHLIMLQTIGAPAVTVSLSQSSVFASRSGAGFVQTNVITATATGGNGGPYTYAWSIVPGGDTEITAQNPSSAATRFQATVGIGDSFSADFTCVASDGIRSSEGANCSVTLEEFA